jgi:LacI family transcriptional regulator
MTAFAEWRLPVSANINDVAAKLELSKGTVSRILNGKGLAFSPKTRERVFAVAEEMGYRPNQIARALAMGRTGFIALWMQHLLTSYYARVARYMEAQIERQPYQVVVRTLGYDNWSGQERAGGGAPWGVDGIIAHGVEGAVQNWLDATGISPADRKPIVTTGNAVCIGDIDNVGVDLGPASTEAVQHLVLTGRRRIAYLTHDTVDRPGDGRHDGYFSVLAEAGLKPETILSRTAARSDARQAMCAFVREHGCPQAIFCHNDDLAIAAYRALCDLGLSVPDDAALVGCDGIEDTEYLPCPISTIVIPMREVAEQAWQFLERRIHDRDHPQQTAMLAPRLVIRESSRP